MTEWTLAVVLGMVGLAGILLFLAKNFEKNQHAVKVFLTMMVLGVLVIVPQTVKLIVEDNATGSTLTSLTLLSTTALIISIVAFSFFMLYFMVTYTSAIFKALRDSRKEKKALEWGE